jgi:hypothetical protein
MNANAAFASRGRTPPAAATVLLDCATLAALAPLWLRQQIDRSGALAGAVFLAEETALTTLAAWGPAAASGFEPVATAAMEAGRGTVSRQDGDTGAILAQPVMLLGADRQVRRAAVALSIADAAPGRIRAAMAELAWGMAWLRGRAAEDALAATGATADRLAAATTLLAAVQTPRDARDAGLRLATGLAHELGADRVSVALRRFGRTEILAISHSAEFGRRMRLNRLVAAAMDEALSQRAALTWPAPPDDPNATRAQAALSADRGGAVVLTVPFRVEGGLWRGAVTVERDPAQPYHPDEVALADAVAALAGPALWDKAENQAWLPVKIWRTLGNQLRRLFGPRHTGRKLALLGLVLAIAVFATWRAPYRVTADAVVEGSVERSLIAPFDGFLREAGPRAGDIVQAGEVIAALDDRDLALEKLRWMTDRRQRELELGRAIGDRDRAEAEIIRAQIAEADARMALVDEQIARARVIAPFDGLIVAGDQSRNIGAAVQQGDVLFELAPVDGVRITLKIDETRVADLAPGQTGELVLASLPGETVPVVFERLTPVAIAEEGRNRFRGEARPAEAVPGLRPGMTGVAKIAVDERLVIEIWTRGMRDWARLALWRWFGVGA